MTCGNVGTVTTRARRGGRDPVRDLKIHGPSHTEAPSEHLGAPPWARVRRVQLIRREIREVLSPSALEVLFDHAELVVEGGEELGGRRAGDHRVFATVMITIDLARCAGQVREPADEATARRVAELMQAEPRVHQRLRSLAARELARLGGAEPEEPLGAEGEAHGGPPEKVFGVTVETAFRVDGTVVLIDVDAMATLAKRRE